MKIIIILIYSICLYIIYYLFNIYVNKIENFDVNKYNNILNKKKIFSHSLLSSNHLCPT